MPRTIGELTAREVPLLREDEPVGSAIERIVEAELPALPVADSEGVLAGIFGEREFIGALFPGYLKTLGYAGFVRRSLDEALEKRKSCGADEVGTHMNTDHIDVGEDFSDIELAEIFLHHRVLIVPIVAGGRVSGIVTREDFFRALAQRVVEP